MTTPETDQSPLFPAPLAGFLGQLSWHPGEGWRLMVRSWDEGDAPGDSTPVVYERLTVSELLDVLVAEVNVRCEWVRP